MSLVIWPLTLRGVAYLKSILVAISTYINKESSFSLNS